MDPKLIEALSRSSASDVPVKAIDPKLVEALGAPTTQKAGFYNPDASWFDSTVDVLDAAPKEFIRDLGRAAMSVGNRVGLVDDDKYKQFETNLNNQRNKDYADWSESKKTALSVATGVGETVGVAVLGALSGVTGAIGGIAGMTPKLAAMAKLGLNSGAVGFLGAREQEDEVGSTALGTLIGTGTGAIGVRANPTETAQKAFQAKIPMSLSEATSGVFSKVLSGVEDVLPGSGVQGSKVETIGKMLGTLEDRLRPTNISKAGSRAEQILDNSQFIQEDLKNTVKNLGTKKDELYQTAVTAISKKADPALMDGFENAMVSANNLAKRQGSSKEFQRLLKDLSNEVTNEPKNALQMQQTMQRARAIVDDAYSLKGQGKIGSEELKKLDEIAGWAQDDLGRLAEKAGAKDLWDNANKYYMDSYRPVKNFVKDSTDAGVSAAGTAEVTTVNKVLQLAAQPDNVGGLDVAKKVIANLSPEGKKSFAFDLVSRTMMNSAKSGQLEEAMAVSKLKGVTDRLGMVLDKDALEATKAMTGLAGSLEKHIGSLASNNMLMQKAFGMVKAGTALGIIGYTGKDLDLSDPTTAFKPAATILTIVLAKSLLSTRVGQQLLVDFNRDPKKMDSFVTQAIPGLISSTITNLDLMSQGRLSDSDINPRDLQDR